MIADVKFQFWIINYNNKKYFLKLLNHMHSSSQLRNFQNYQEWFLVMPNKDKNLIGSMKYIPWLVGLKQYLRLIV